MTVQPVEKILVKKLLPSALGPAGPRGPCAAGWQRRDACAATVLHDTLHDTPTNATFAACYRAALSVEPPPAIDAGSPPRVDGAGTRPSASSWRPPWSSMPRAGRA